MSDVIDVIDILSKALVVHVTNSKKRQSVTTKHWLLTFFYPNLVWAHIRCTASYFTWECETTILEITILGENSPCLQSHFVAVSDQLLPRFSQ